MAVGAEEVVAVAAGGVAVAEVGATRGATARCVTVGAKGRATALIVLGPPAEDAL